MKIPDGLPLGNLGGTGGTGYQNAAPLFFAENETEMEQLKMSHETYEVFVNDDFVGHKVLLNMNEEVEDIHSFLKSRGFFDYSAEKTGNEFRLSTDDTYQAELMKENLSVYLQIR